MVSQYQVYDGAVSTAFLRKRRVRNEHFARPTTARDGFPQFFAGVLQREELLVDSET
jgi:hypothetical protein